MAVKEILLLGDERLYQNEYDHLDGILAVQRAIDDRFLKLELTARY